MTDPAKWVRTLRYELTTRSTSPFPRHYALYRTVKTFLRETRESLRRMPNTYRAWRRA